MSVNTIIRQLAHIKKSVMDSHDNLTLHMRELWGVISSVTDASLAQHILQHSELCDFFVPYWAQYLQQQEMSYCSSIRAAHENIPSLLSKAEQYYPSSIEFSLLPATENGCFIMAGCGSYPETLINISQGKYGFSSLIGLDSSPQCVEAAHAIKLMQHNMRFIAVETSAYDFSEASVVLLANGLRRKGAALQQISRTAPEGATILVRVPVLLGVLLYEAVTESFAISCGLTKQGQVETSPLSLTLAFKKLVA